MLTYHFTNATLYNILFIIHEKSNFKPSYIICTLGIFIGK